MSVTFGSTSGQDWFIDMRAYCVNAHPTSIVTKFNSGSSPENESAIVPLL